MDLTRKDFLRRSSTAVLPVVLTGAAFPGSPQRSGLAPLASLFNVRQFGATGNGQSKDTRAIESTMDAAGVSGGTVYFPPGKYLSGTIRFKSHITVFLDVGATLLMSPDPADFDPYEKLNFKSYSDEETTDFHFALLRGQDLEDVAVMGPGIIDGNRTKRHGPKPVAFKNCRHVAVRDVTIRNSPNYNVSLLGCDEVNIDGVTILNGYCDGIDPDCCRQVRISNCYVETWDDAIVPKASFALGYRRSTENLVVTNCVLTTACNCFKLGTESSGDFKNITVSNCAMFARSELWKRRPISGVALEMVDGASIERIAVSNIVMNEIESPIFIRLGNRGRAQTVPTPEHLQDVSISDVIATGATRASLIAGIPGFPVRRVTLRNIQLTAKGGGAADLIRKPLPELEDKYPEAKMFGELPGYGLFCRHAEDLMLDAVQFRLEQADARPAMIIDDAEGVELRALSADPPSGKEPAICLRDVRRCFMQGLRAQPRTRLFCQLAGSQTSGVFLTGSELTEAETAFQIEPGVDKSTFRQTGNFLPGQ